VRLAVTTFHVAIVGAGQRGITVLERIGALYRDAPLAAKFVVHLIDPADSGQGVHRTEQAQHLITNTPAHQTTVFVDASVLGGGSETKGPTYADWLADTRRHAAFAASESGRAEVDLFTPRALLGEYLRDAFLFILAGLPAGVAVTEHRATAVAIRTAEPDAYQILLDSGQALTVSYVFFCTGHGTNPVEGVPFCSQRAERRKGVDGATGIQAQRCAARRLDDVDRGVDVLVVGAGLTAIDIVSTLTRGRGGRFERLSERRYEYVPSGDEPRITLCSRQGLPPLCKGRAQTAHRPKYEPRFFTEAFVTTLRRSKWQLDWETDLWPALKRDMVACYAYTANESGRPAPHGPRAEVESLVDQWLFPWRGRRIVDRQAHRAFLEAYVAGDLDDAFVGALSSPGKAVSEMLRDLNDVVRSAVDYGGLTPQSHERFLRQWVSINNRVAAGPPTERSIELLALLKAGVVRIFEPAPSIEIDAAVGRVAARSDFFGYESAASFEALVEARVRPLDLDRTAEPLFAAGRDAGLLAPFRNGTFSPGGLSINEDLNVLDRSGRPNKRIWALGHCVEGAHYYTYVLPAPQSNSRNLRDCAKAALAMLMHARRAITEEQQVAHTAST
jgi:hypothetical protein